VRIEIRIVKSAPPGLRDRVIAGLLIEFRYEIRPIGGRIEVMGHVGAARRAPGNIDQYDWKAAGAKGFSEQSCLADNLMRRMGERKSDNSIL
jgi:hypothetical protein